MTANNNDAADEAVLRARCRELRRIAVKYLDASSIEADEFVRRLFEGMVRRLGSDCTFSDLQNHPAALEQTIDEAILGIKKLTANQRRN